MKKIALLRHGTAAWNASEDIQRSLSEEGINEAVRAGKWLSEKLKLDFMMVSPAVRTRMTAEAVQKSFDSIPKEENKDLYPTELTKAFRVIGKLNDTHQNVLVVAHNPGISELADYLTGEFGLNFIPGQMIIIGFEADSWSEISSGQGTILEQFLPNS